jgi:hypothetical protein
MPEPVNSSALVPTAQGQYDLKIRELDASGKATELSVPMPTTSEFAKWTLLQQVAMLKKGPWKASPINEIMFAVAYANSLGLDVMRGDVFPTGEGRLGTSNKAKIKLALATGQIEGIETSMRELPEDAPAGCASKKDLECTVTIYVKGWQKPITRKAKLSRWFKASNPNWKGNPEHMLELNTVAHACEYVHPTATEDDEAPPASQTPLPIIDAEVVA